MIKLRSLLNESETGVWTKGSKNTKTYVVNAPPNFVNSKLYLQGCKHCGEVTDLKNRLETRQYIGNVYQSLCNCSKCNRFVIFDEHKFNDLDSYLKYKSKNNSI